MRRFDPAVYQPHPPGYFLYICLGRLFNTFFHDENAALVSVGVVASCGALALVYALTAEWFGRRSARFAGVLFVFSPLVWFHGTVALTYETEAFFSALVGYLLWRVYRGQDTLIVPAMVALGLGAGFRPSFLLFLSPLALFSLWFRPAGVSFRPAAGGMGALTITLSAWFAPMIREGGGLNVYVASLLSLWRMVPAKETAFNSSLGNSVARMVTVAGIYVLCFGSATLLLARGRKAWPPVGSARRAFIGVWIVPGLLFFTMVFLKFVNSGYLLVISPPVFAWMGWSAATWYREFPGHPAVRMGLVAAFALVNSAIFLFAPVYCSYASVRGFEAELKSVLRAVNRAGSPDERWSSGDTMIVGFDSHFLGYRHAGYYLPGWFTAQYPEVRLGQGTRVFTMQGGDTRLEGRLPLSRFRRFVFFPLPLNDPEYATYMARVRARFPAGALRRTVVDGREIYTGSAADLRYLFPVTTADVHPGDHPGSGTVSGR